MANENKKDFNAMMKNNKDMPKIRKISYSKSNERLSCKTK